MDKYINSIVTSTKKYLLDLEYLAKDNKNVLNDLFNLQIYLNVLDWMVWVEYPESNKIKIEEKINKIIWKNPNLAYVINDFKYYKNVNTRQNIWTWQRIYDNINVKEINSLT